MKKYSEIELPRIDIVVHGKRFFDVPAFGMKDLKGKPIIITDFEDNCKTKHGFRMVITFTFEKSGSAGKFYTGNRYMKAILYKMKEIEEIPFKTVLKLVEDETGRKEYIFS